MDELEYKADTGMDEVQADASTFGNHSIRLVFGFSDCGYNPHDGQRGLRDCPDESGAFADGCHIKRIEHRVAGKHGDTIAHLVEVGDAQQVYYAAEIKAATDCMLNAQTEAYQNRRAA